MGSPRKSTRYSFDDFLHGYNPKAETPVGDFVRDALADRQFPLDVRSWGRLESYLMFRNACEPAIDAARECWWHYRQARKLWREL